MRWRSRRLARLVLLAAIGSLAVASPAAADPDLLGEWHLDQMQNSGDATITPDSSGKGNNLNVPGGGGVNEIVSDGRFGNAFHFDGSDELYTGTSLNPPRVTLLAWVRRSGSPGNAKYIAAQGGSNCNYSSYALYTGGNGGLQFYIWNGSSLLFSPDAGSGIWDGHWHAVAGVFDGSAVRLYVDGTEVGSGSLATGSIAYGLSDTSFEVATYPVGPCSGFNYSGDIDELRVYDRALSTTELNYLQSAPGSTPPELPVPVQSGPAVTTGQATGVSQTAATLHGTVNPAGAQVTDCRFDYGTSLAYGSSIPCSPAPGGGSGAVAVSAALSGLAAGTTYDFRLVASNGHGTSYGGNQSFTTTGTSAPPPPPPPRGSSPPVARFTVPGLASTLKGGVWFNGALSAVGVGSSIVDYAWDTNGDGLFDWHCGRSPVATMAFTHTGPQTVGLKVTDTFGRSSVFTERVTIPASALKGIRIPTPTFDCENPAAGNQPDRADCIKSFGFGIIDANSRGEPSDCFQITSQLNRNALQVNPARFAHTSEARDRATAAFKRNPFLVYHATLKGPVAINGLYLPLPESNQSEYDQGSELVTLGHVNVQIGRLLTQRVALDNVKVFPDSHGVVHVDDLFLKGANAALGALPVKGKIGIDLIYHASKIHFHLELPPPFTLGYHVGSTGSSSQGDLYLLSDNENGIHLDGAQLGPLDAFIGPLYVKNLRFKFLQSEDLWEGSAALYVPGVPPDVGFGLNAAQPPPDAGFGMRHGHFDHAGVGLDFPPEARPELFPGIFLSNIHAALGTRPLRLTGGIAVSAADLVDINGDVFVAFATPDQPYDFPTDEAAGDLAPLAGRHFDSFSIAVGGTASLHVPFFGDIGLGNAHFLYEYPDFVEVGAAYSLDLTLVKFSGDLNGFVLPSARKFSFDSQVTACPNFKVKLPIVGEQTIDKPCFGAGVALSTAGVGVCGTVPIPFFTGAVPVTITVGYKWGGDVGVALFSCDLSPYEEANPRAAQAGSVQGFTLPGGLPSAMVRVRGRSGAPNVTLSGPGHVSIDTANPPQNPNVVVMVNGDTTLIALKHPAGGSWRVAADPGSAPIIDVASAQGLRSPQITASVSGRGARRTLSYRISAQRGMQITFAERGSRTYRVIGTARGSHGRISFNSATGRAGRREILALIGENGIRTRSLVVARYFAQGSTRPGRIATVRLTHAGTTLSVSWSKATGASYYEVVVAGSDGSRTLRVTRARRLRLGGVASSLSGSVIVQGLAPGSIRGPATRKSFTRARRRR